ncbi:methyltransferase domain family [Clostridium botulinum C str. Eklund]|nr:methyltransferase domain family [Clostridium botulinum C str. Eklund]NEZ48434.1 class I SAM-dependent methyltransferase [Clostridium botulinum]
MANLTDGFWNKIGDVNSDVFGIGIFGDGGIYEVPYRHYYEVKNLKKLVKFTTNMKVLELGCGGGRFAMDIAPLVNKYVGIDYSEKAIDIAQKQSEKLCLSNTEFIQGSAVDFKYDDKFDVVYFGCVLQYLKEEEVKKTLKNLKRNLKDNTIIIDRSSNFNNIRHIADSILYYCIYRTPKEIENLFKNTGYKLVSRKRSYNFLTAGLFMRKYLKSNIMFRKSIYKIMNIFSNVFNSFIYNDRKGNYFSHDFFVFKRSSK